MLNPDIEGDTSTMTNIVVYGLAFSPLVHGVTMALEIKGRPYPNLPFAGEPVAGPARRR